LTQDEQPWLVNSSTSTGGSAKAALALAASETPKRKTSAAFASSLS